MSVLALALQRLSEPSRRDIPKDRPSGTALEKAESQCPSATPLSGVPLGQLSDTVTNGTWGTLRTGGTAESLLEWPRPEGTSPERWERLRAGAARFAEEWADKALLLGWTRGELFAVVEPFANVSMQGAAWFVGDADIVDISRTGIALRTASGATQTIYRVPLDSTVRPLNFVSTALDDYRPA